MENKFIELCEAYHEKILKYLYYSLGNLEDAKDLTQEVFTHVYTQFEELQDHPNLGGYIYQTAKFKAANHKRKISTKKKHEVFKVYAGGKDLDAHSQWQHDLDAEIDEGLFVDCVLDRLSRDKRELYDDYYKKGLSYKEIAKKHKISEPALRMKYMRIRREVKTYVKEISSANFVTEE